MKKILKDWVPSILIIFAIIFTKIAILDVVTVKGASMQPTLSNKDKLVIEKISQYSNRFKHGDIVILSMDNQAHWVKRVIALGGDTIEVKNNILYVNDNIVEENYIDKDTSTSNVSKRIVPEGHMYVLGDNREVGFIDYDKVVGKVIFKLSLAK